MSKYNNFRKIFVRIGFQMTDNNSFVHRCGACGNMRACHAAGPGSIPGRDKFPG